MSDTFGFFLRTLVFWRISLLTPRERRDLSDWKVIRFIMKALLACLLLFCAVGQLSARAGVLTLRLTSAADLSSLTVGETFTMDVNLEGLSGESSLSTLASTLLFSHPSFGPPASGNAVTPGPIVIDPLADFFGDAFPPFGAVELVDGQFFSGDVANNIASDGRFFSFTLQATSAGSGTIEFDPLSLSAFDDQSNFYVDPNDPFADPEFVIQTNSLTFDVSPGSAVVPEPASIIGFACLSSIVAGAAFRRRRLVCREG